MDNLPNPIPAPQDEAEAKLLALIKEHGWAIQLVGSGDGEPEFAYTVGLVRAFDHPEIIIFGQKFQLMKGLLNFCGEEIRRGERFENGKDEDGILGDYTVTFRSVPASQYPTYVGWAAWFNQDWNFPVLQLIYPDLEGRWPWDEGVHPGFVNQQPVLADRR